MDRDNEAMSAICSNYYFKSLEELAKKKLAEHVNLFSIKKNETLFRKGDFADAFYIVKEGAIRITAVDSQGNDIVLARIAPGGFFGEQAFLNAPSARRLATAIAHVDSVLYQFPREALLHLSEQNKQLVDALREKSAAYVEDGLHKFVDDIDSFKQLLTNKRNYQEREVLFFQNDPCVNAYLLTSGEVELRQYNEDKQLLQVTSITPGQFFAEDCFDKAGYPYMAVAKREAQLIVFDKNKYKELKQHRTLFKQVATNHAQVFSYKQAGKVLQFSSEVAHKPAITSIITLKDGLEIVCEQVIGAEIFLASIPTKEAKIVLRFEKEGFLRELRLCDGQLVGLIESGIWDDSYQLLDLMINQNHLSPEQLVEFEQTGHMKFEESLDVPHEEMVCRCMRVSYERIQKLIINKKADLNTIKEATGATTICGGCRPVVLEMLGESAWQLCTLTKVITHKEDIKTFQFTPAVNTHLKTYKPGQYIVIKAEINGVWVQRTYTLTSIAGESYYEVTIKKEPLGVFSRWIFEQAENKPRLYVAEPYGYFTLEKTRQSPIVCIMGGIGITPAIAFLRQIKQMHSERQVYIDYSIRDADQMILHEELSAISKAHKNIFINTRFTKTEGHLTTSDLEKIVQSIEDCHVFMCGPKGLEEMVVETYRKMNLPLERLHIEEFAHAGAPEGSKQTID